MVKVIDSHYLTITAIVTVVYQLIFFVITALFKFDQVTDFAGSTNFVILAVLTLVLKGTWHFRQVVLTSLVVVWGLRLGMFLLMRILKWGEDRRFDEMRENMGKLVVFWIFQAVWMLLWWGIYVASLPVLKGAEYLVIVGPIFLTLLLFFVSGIPLLEESADKKYGNLGAYRHYKKTTSPLILLPRGVYGYLPKWCKTVFLFEFPLYSKNLPHETTVWWVS
ncbi:hypothetical protein Bca101_066239 [Brassica carinata]